jgi:hypothetical protein
MFQVRCMPKPAEHPNANAGAAANDWITHSFPIWLEELNKARREPLKLVDAGDPRVLLALERLNITTSSLSALQPEHATTKIPLSLVGTAEGGGVDTNITTSPATASA